MSRGLSLFGKKDNSSDDNKVTSNNLNLVDDEDDTDLLSDEAFQTTMDKDDTASLENLDNYNDEIFKKDTSNNKGTTTGNDFTIFEWYWQICTPKRAYFCITKFGRLVPKISNHMMANYLRSISKTTVFYTRDEVKKSTLKAAIIGSCKEENNL